ncbi:YitT family protein [Peribacillus cavernae]|uniref:YitT family protein n=1 Tax=Peribacillus cavernae TaxID=1674310 RepID=UPI00351FDB49
MIGSLSVGIGVNFFLAPYHLLDGGLIGIALLMHYHFGSPIGLMIIIISIPLYIYVWSFERMYFVRSVHGLLFSSLCIDLFSNVETDWKLPVLVSAILGGIIIGLGVGLMLRYETSTGGTDLLAQIISSKTAINVGILILVIDGSIILSGIGIVGVRAFFYSSLTIMIVGILTSLTAGNEG